jgi:hypothetical protein
MRRRDFVVGLLLTGTTVSARAQRRAKVYRLAIVDTVNPVIELTEAGELPYYRGFFERLHNWDLPRDKIFKSSDILVRANRNVLTTWSRRWSTSSQTQSS